MQLIFESEPTLAVKRDMSAVEDNQNEKNGNSDIVQISEKICNGNKENLGEVNIIIKDDVNKPIINENEALLDSTTDTKPENNEVETSTEVADEDKTCKVNNLKDNDLIQIGESQSNGTDEKISNTEEQTSNTDNKNSNIDEKISSTSEKDLDIKGEETVEENTVENAEEDKISKKEENVNQILEILDKDSKEVCPEADVKTAIEENLSSEKDDVVVVEEPTETTTVCETEPDVKLKEISNETSESQDKQLVDNKTDSKTPDCDSTEVITKSDAQNSSPIELKDDIDEEVVFEETKPNKQDIMPQQTDTPSVTVDSSIDKPVLCKLSNTLDILSDDEDEPPKAETPMVVDANEKQCINIEDDDDIMLIDEDTSKTETPQPMNISNDEVTPINADIKSDTESGKQAVDETIDLFAKTEQKEPTPSVEIDEISSDIKISEKQEDKQIEKQEVDAPLVPENFLKTAKKNLADMTREDLEEFCILKIVESIVDRSNLSEIKNKLKTVAQGVEEYRKKTMMLTKQNRDLQVVLKSIQEEQKKMTPGTPITPLKITRSVGMQVIMEKTGARRKPVTPVQNSNNINLTPAKNAKIAPALTPRPSKPASNQAIPVPRLVPANSPAIKPPSAAPLANQVAPSKTASPIPNGIKNPSPVQKVAEKRQHNRMMAVTVDLTDDEPPTKNNKTSPAPPVRVVPSQNLMATPRQQFSSSVSSPRKVYIPISGPQNQGLRPGQTIMLKTVNPPGLRPRCPTPQVARLPQNAIRMNRGPTGRHPAPLPEFMKQYQPPNWKALPPAPDLKLSKVENGIVISWKIEGYQEDSYEEIASYQLYAYQETSAPPSTSLWKKIGDVKALPLPMACTLTQFMAGFKYFFAVRAVDIRSRLGPFSLPGSILLLNKL